MAAWLAKLKAFGDDFKNICVDEYKDKPQSDGAEGKDIELNEVMGRIGFGKFQIKLLFVVSVIWIADAMEIMMISFITPAVSCEFELTSASKATLTMVVGIGMLIGAFSWGLFDDRFGRKKGSWTKFLKCLQDRIISIHNVSESVTSHQRILYFCALDLYFWHFICVCLGVLGAVFAPVFRRIWRCR